MENALSRIIADAISSDFWGEDSLLVDTFAEENSGQQLDCEGLTVDYSDENSVKVFIGEKTYLISVKEI